MKAEEDEDEDVTIGVTRYPCLPSLVALQQMRNRLHMAQVGKRLMKWTAMATGRELRNVARQIQIVYRDYAEDVRNAYMLLARCRYFFPNLNNNVLNNIGNEAAVTVTTTPKGLTGVKVMEFEIQESGVDNYVYLGLERGGQTIDETKELWLSILKRSVQILQLRTSFNLVDIAHKSATKRSNTLKRVIIPRIQLSIQYILAELEEREREDTFRLKRFKQKKDAKLKKLENIQTAQDDICCLCKQMEEDISSYRKSLGMSDGDIPVNQLDMERFYNICSCSDNDSSDAQKERLELLMSQLDKIINLTQQYKSDGAVIHSMDTLINACNMLRAKIDYEYRNLSENCRCSKIDRCITEPPCTVIQNKELTNDCECPSPDKEVCELSPSSIKSEQHEELTEDCICSPNKSADKTNSTPTNEENKPFSCLVDDCICPSQSEIASSCEMPSCSHNIREKSMNWSDTAKPMLCMSCLNYQKSIKEPEKLDRDCQTEEDQFGYFEQKYQEIVKVKRLKNRDGTVSEVKQVITVKVDKKQPRNPAPISKSKSTIDDNEFNDIGSYNSTCSCPIVSDLKSNSYQKPKKNKSQTSTRSSKLVVPMLRRSCTSIKKQTSTCTGTSLKDEKKRIVTCTKSTSTTLIISADGSLNIKKSKSLPKSVSVQTSCKSFSKKLKGLRITISRLMHCKKEPQKEKTKFTNDADCSTSSILVSVVSSQNNIVIEPCSCEQNSLSKKAILEKPVTEKLSDRYIIKIRPKSPCYPTIENQPKSDIVRQDDEIKTKNSNEKKVKEVGKVVTILKPEKETYVQFNSPKSISVTSTSNKTCDEYESLDSASQNLCNDCLYLLNLGLPNESVNKICQTNSKEIKTPSKKSCTECDNDLEAKQSENFCSNFPGSKCHYCRKKLETISDKACKLCGKSTCENELSSKDTNASNDNCQYCGKKIDIAVDKVCVLCGKNTCKRELSDKRQLAQIDLRKYCRYCSKEIDVCEIGGKDVFPSNSHLASKADRLSLKGICKNCTPKSKILIEALGNDISDDTTCNDYLSRLRDSNSFPNKSYTIEKTLENICHSCRSNLGNLDEYNDIAKTSSCESITSDDCSPNCSDICDRTVVKKCTVCGSSQNRKNEEVITNVSLGSFDIAGSCDKNSVSVGTSHNQGISCQRETKHDHVCGKCGTLKIKVSGDRARGRRKKESGNPAIPCTSCKRKDASTMTKWIDKYDVRPINEIYPKGFKTGGNKVRKTCSCSSDMNSNRSTKKSIFKCHSFYREPCCRKFS